MMTMRWRWCWCDDDGDVDGAVGEADEVDDLSLVDEVFDGAFGGDGDEDFVTGEGVVVSSSSLLKSTEFSRWNDGEFDFLRRVKG
ncbi:hypothetical protein Tco_0597495 [Tanacetum coccineum]